MAIAVHRYILLGETAQRYELTPSRTRFRRFLALTILIESALLVPRLAGMLVGATPARGMVVAVVIVLVLYLVLRTLLLFPAIATDAPGADWERAMQDSNGRAWRIFLVLLIAFVPIIVASALLLLSVGRSGVTGHGTFAVIAVINAVAALAWLVVGAAVASRLYRAYADAMESG